MSKGAMTCHELVRLVTEYLEGALAAEDEARFDAHIQRCSGCGAYLEQMRATIAMTGALREEDIAPPERETLLSAFRDWKGRSRA